MPSDVPSDVQSDVSSNAPSNVPSELPSYIPSQSPPACFDEDANSVTTVNLVVLPPNIPIGAQITCAFFESQTFNSGTCNFLSNSGNLQVTVGTKLYSQACCNCGGGQHAVA